MNRRLLARQFTTPGTSPWKTFVVEAHPHGESAGNLLTEAFPGARVETTDDVHLHRVVVNSELQFTVDDLDDRFWSFHTTAPMDMAAPAIRRPITSRRDLDFVWLPSHHLRQVRPGVHPSSLKTEFKGWGMLPERDVQELSVTVRGHNADRLLDVIRGQEGHGHAVSVDHLTFSADDPDLGHVKEAVNRYAQFTASGDSFALHQEVVAGVIDRYRRFVEAVEARSIRFSPFGDDGGGQVAGGPIELRFSRPLPNVAAFLAELVSSREPFRLWGIDRADHGYGECDGVDLHVGQRVRVEVQPEFLRLFLFDGGCGNTVARLVSNLQHHVDGALELLDPELNELLTLSHVMAGTPA